MRIEFPHALQDPQTATPPRCPGTVRRTSHIDIATGSDGRIRLSGAARDVVTGVDGAGHSDESRIDALLDSTFELVALSTHPDDPDFHPLLGRRVASGFRAALRDVFARRDDAGGPLELLLDDLPVGALISGYERMYAGKLDRTGITVDQVRADICSGWRSDGRMVSTIREQETMPVPVGPLAPDLDAGEDRGGWHRMDPIDPESMRRRRLIELTPGTPGSVFAMFRDTHKDDAGVERVLHEYALGATLDLDSMRLTNCVASPRALPWPECPWAADSAPRLEGARVQDIPSLVGREFRGTGTCTHLNDLLRSLGGLVHLAGLVP